MAFHPLVNERSSPLKVDREKGDTAQQAQLDKLVITIRWVAAAILLPVGLYVADVIMNRGG